MCTIKTVGRWVIIIRIKDNNRENENNNTDATTTTTPPEEPTIYWDLEDIEEEDIDGVNKHTFELEGDIFRSPGLSEAFQCGYNLGLNNSSLTREQISK